MRKINRPKGPLPEIKDDVAALVGPAAKQAGPPANSQDTLMLSLAEIAGSEDFLRRGPSFLAWSRGYKEGLLYKRYLAAGPQEKIPLCREMVRSRTPGHRQSASAACSKADTPMT